MKDKLLLVFVLGVLFCAVGWTVSAQLQRGSVSRQNWEYKSIAVDGMYWEEDGRQSPGIAPVAFYPRLRVLGEQGWEMFAISDAANGSEGRTTTRTVYWFKRAN